MPSLTRNAAATADNGVTDFDRLMARGHDASAYAYAFDLLAIDDRDVRDPKSDTVQWFAGHDL